MYDGGLLVMSLQVNTTLLMIVMWLRRRRR